MDDAEESRPDAARGVGTDGVESFARVEIDSEHIVAANLALSGGLLVGVGAVIVVEEAAGVWLALPFILLWIVPLVVAQVLVDRFARGRGLLDREDRVALGVAAGAAAVAVLLSTYGGFPLLIWFAAAGLAGASCLVLLRSHLRRRGIPGLDRS